MRASLFFKFTLAFILVVLAGISLMAFLANRSATGGLSLYVDRGSELWAHRLAPVLVAYYSRQQSWAGIDQFLTQGPRVDVRRRVGQSPLRRTLDGPSDKKLWWLADHRLILGDSQNRVVFDSDSQMTGQDLGTIYVFQWCHCYRIWGTIYVFQWCHCYWTINASARS